MSKVSPVASAMLRSLARRVRHGGAGRARAAAGRSRRCAGPILALPAPLVATGPRRDGTGRYGRRHGVVCRAGAGRGGRGLGMGLFSRRGGEAAGVERPTGRSGEVQRHLAEFASTRDGLEAYIEPATTVTPTTLLLVAGDGEWTRRAGAEPAGRPRLRRASSAWTSTTSTCRGTPAGCASGTPAREARRRRAAPPADASHGLAQTERRWSLGESACGSSSRRCGSAAMRSASVSRVRTATPVPPLPV